MPGPAGTGCAACVLPGAVLPRHPQGPCLGAGTSCAVPLLVVLGSSPWHSLALEPCGRTAVCLLASPHCYCHALALQPTMQPGTPFTTSHHASLATSVVPFPLPVLCSAPPNAATLLPPSLPPTTPPSLPPPPPHTHTNPGAPPPASPQVSRQMVDTLDFQGLHTLLQAKGFKHVPKAAAQAEGGRAGGDVGVGGWVGGQGGGHIPDCKSSRGQTSVGNPQGVGHVRKPVGQARSHGPHRVHYPLHPFLTQWRRPVVLPAPLQWLRSCKRCCGRHSSSSSSQLLAELPQAGRAA